MVFAETKMDEHQHPGSGPPKRSIEELIENISAERVNSEGQYVQLGFPAPIEPQWSSYLPQPPQFMPSEAEQLQQSRFLSARSNSQPTIGAHNDEFVGFFNYNSPVNSIFPPQDPSPLR
jgi:hypothetical protein